MSENVVSSRGSTQPPSITVSQHSPPSRPRNRAWNRVGRLLPMLSLAGLFVFAMWLVLAKSSPLYALIAPPHTADFTTSADVVFGKFGFSVESAGDINKDGFGDVIVGADAANSIYVYIGSNTGLTSTIFFSDTGLLGENLGWSVAGGGDINQDGVDDLVAGTPH